MRLHWRISIHKALAGLDCGKSMFRRPAGISIHKALAGLDPVLTRFFSYSRISIHKALAGLDSLIFLSAVDTAISIHKALAGLDISRASAPSGATEFQSTRPSRASTDIGTSPACTMSISIHKALAGLDYTGKRLSVINTISIHKALAGLDKNPSSSALNNRYFNPQGPRGPRLYRHTDLQAL